MARKFSMAGLLLLAVLIAVLVAVDTRVNGKSDLDHQDQVTITPDGQLWVVPNPQRPKMTVIVNPPKPPKSPVPVASNPTNKTSSSGFFQGSD